MKVSRYNPEGYCDPTAYAALSHIEEQRIAGKPVHRIVYICSPYAGDVEYNVRKAQAYCRFAVESDCVPIATHLLFPQFMDDTDPGERQQALLMSGLLLSKCNEVWVFGEKVSSGMLSEIRKATAHNKPVRYFTTDCKEVKVS